jgi:hypothetical protein
MKKLSNIEVDLHFSAYLITSTMCNLDSDNSCRKKMVAIAIATDIETGMYVMMYRYTNESATALQEL